MMLLPLLFLIIVLVDSWTDAMKPLGIKHVRGAVLYIAACAVVAVLIVGSWTWCIGFAMFTRAAWFSPFFNKWTGNPFTYNGDKRSRKRARFDKFNEWLCVRFGISMFWIRIIYIALWVVYLIIFYSNVK